MLYFCIIKTFNNNLWKTNNLLYLLKIIYVQLK